MSDPLQDYGVPTFSLLFSLLCSIRHCRHRHCRHRHRRGRKERITPREIFDGSSLYVLYHDHSKKYTRHSNQKRTVWSNYLCPLKWPGTDFEYRLSFANHVGRRAIDLTGLTNHQ